MGNAASALLRAVQELRLDPSSAAGQAAASLQRGKMPLQRHDQFFSIMEQSGVDRATAANILRQTGTNSRYMTPAVARAVQRAQYSIDVKPHLDLIDKRYPGNDVISQQNRQGAADLFYERQLGLPGGAAQGQQLYGPTAPNTSSVWAQAEQMGKLRSQQAHLGREGPVSRIISTVSSLKPGDQMGVKDIFARGMGAVPKQASTADKAVDVAGEAILGAVGVKTQEETDEEKRLEKAVQRNMREREARRIARARSKGLPPELVT
jgi:hypothetical protein